MFLNIFQNFKHPNIVLPGPVVWVEPVSLALPDPLSFRGYGFCLCHPIPVFRGYGFSTFFSGTGGLATAPETKGAGGMQVQVLDDLRQRLRQDLGAIFT